MLRNVDKYLEKVKNSADHWYSAANYIGVVRFDFLNDIKYYYQDDVKGELDMIKEGIEMIYYSEKFIW